MIALGTDSTLQRIRLAEAETLLTIVLRHRPETISLKLDSEGWASVQDLVSRAPSHLGLSEAAIRQIALFSTRKRFELSADGTLVRAVHGHSLPVDLHLTPSVPPSVLLHGTSTSSLAQIGEKGLVRGFRNHEIGRAHV